MLLIAIALQSYYLLCIFYSHHLSRICWPLARLRCLTAVRGNTRTRRLLQIPSQIRLRAASRRTGNLVNPSCFHYLQSCMNCDLWMDDFIVYYWICLEWERSPALHLYKASLSLWPVLLRDLSGLVGSNWHISDTLDTIRSASIHQALHLQYSLP